MYKREKREVHYIVKYVTFRGLKVKYFEKETDLVSNWLISGATVKDYSLIFVC